MFTGASRVLEQAVRDKAFPAAVIEVGTTRRTVWRRAFGRLTFDVDAPPAAEDTIFDLASLTKVLATASLVMRHVDWGTLTLDDVVSRHVPAWRGADRAAVTIRDLLSHCGGLSAYLPLFRDHTGRGEFEPAICAAPIEYGPRSKSIYSDLGFMLLGFMLEASDPLPHGFDAMRAEMNVVEPLRFNPPAAWQARTAPTELDPWRGRLLVGEVHDENCAALGGAAGHAGLFGTAAAVGACARHYLQILDGGAGAFQRATLEAFISRRADVPGSSRALGWDTMLPTSSCGARLSSRSFGHTGFTGTSLWIDPDAGAYVVLLTNRVHPTRANDAITHVRPAVHDAVMEEWRHHSRT